MDMNEPPYVYQPFPKMLYGKTLEDQRIVHTADELDAAIAAGWSVTVPDPHAPPPVPETLPVPDVPLEPEPVRRPVGRPKRDPR